MQPPAPPTIFSNARRAATDARRDKSQRLPSAPRYIMDDMVDDIGDRIEFLRHDPRTAWVLGDWTGAMSSHLTDLGCTVISHPAAMAQFDLVVSLGILDTVNDVPGELIRYRQALASGGLMMASLVGAGSLPALRAAMLAGDGDRPAARIHPAIDVRAGGQLLQRTGYARPVIDSRELAVRFGSLDRLVTDLRAQGLGNVLAAPAPPLSRPARDIARQAFLNLARMMKMDG